LPALLSVDAAGTLRGVGNGLLGVLFLLLPVLFFAKKGPKKKLVWLVPYFIFFLIAYPTLPFALNTAPRWLIAIACCAIACWLTWRTRFQLIIILPIIVTFTISLSTHHSKGWKIVYDNEGLDARCEENAGYSVRCPTVASDSLSYFKLIEAGPDSYWLIGEGGGWWIERGEDGLLRRGEASYHLGNPLNGCLLNEELWVTSRFRFVRVTVPTDPAFPDIMDLEAPRELRDEGEVDYLTTVCDPARDALYFTTLLKGELWVLKPGLLSSDRQSGDDHERVHHIETVDPEAIERLEVPGVGHMGALRTDGRVTLSTTSRLQIWDPDEQRIDFSTPSAIGSIHMDMCPLDDAVVVPDLTGRVRVFESDGNGGYEFAWGISLTAPRWAGFSPDCQQIAITSADDHSVTVIDRESREVVCTFHSGPGLRIPTYVGPREIAVANMCGLSVVSCDADADSASAP